jgi:hypothetical protein
MGDMIAGSLQFYYRVGSADAVTLIRCEAKLPAAYAKLPQFPADIFGIKSQVYQGAQGHIAGNSGKTFKVQGFQLQLPGAWIDKEQAQYSAVSAGQSRARNF